MSPADDPAHELGSGVGALGTLAGCSKASGSDQPAYARWLPRPESIYDPQSESGDATTARPALSTRYFPFRAATYDGIADYTARHGTEYAPPGRSGSLHPVVDLWVEDVSFTVQSDRGFQVSETDLEADHIVAAFEEREFERDATYEGYQTLTSTESSWVAAVDGGRLVEAWQPGLSSVEVHAPSRAVERLIDLGAGRREGLVESDDGVAALTERLGTATRLSGATYERVTGSDPESGQFRGQVADGGVRDVDGSTTELRYVLVFASDADLPVAEIEAWTDPNRPPETNYFERWTDVSVSTEGRAVVVEGTTDTADAFEWGDPFEQSSPRRTTTGTDS